MEINATYTSLVALGDSFTEGMSDLKPDGSYRGWADVLAGRLAARTPGFRYANLAVRGKLIGQIVDEQVDLAAGMKADVVTLVGGLNDTLRPKVDMVRVRDLLTEAVERLTPSCGQLVLMRSPGREGPVMERFRPRMEELFIHLDELADRHGALVVDLYGSSTLGDPRLWDVDRLHLTADGHRRVAEAVWQTLGLPAEDDWRTPLPPAGRTGWTSRRIADARFAKEHLGPWIGRRLTGRSSGDGRAPKRPELLPYEAPVGP
ncbi:MULTISPECIES: SGNH/GDSL hydrolase family protein [Streptomyces]|uniref:SGNH/GDSL hydrolase family protein n=1 Tax=Streptomyces TaxID=1883 RepID=UPI0004654B78|nr:SGNH/GDSL hydrolase family protein [Streptomyces exfoliatus]